MKKLNITLVIILGLCLAVSCNNQSKPQQTSQTETTNQQEDEVYLDDVDEYDEYNDEVPEADPNGYKWIEGVWAASDDYGNFARLIITDTYLQMVNSNWNELTDKVEDQPKQEYNIEVRYNDIFGENILSMNDYVGVDVENHCPYVILSEYSSLSLNKIEGETTEAAITKANLPTLIGIHGITDPVSYTWVDENLKGKVKSYTETARGWKIKKVFDEEGRLVSYTRNSGTVLECGSYPRKDVYPLGIPIEDRRTHLFDCCSFYPFNQGYHGGHYYLLEHNFLNPMLMLGVGGPSSNTYRFEYDSRGCPTNVLDEKNNLLYSCEYDIYGRLVKRLIDGKPLLKVLWDDSYGTDKAAYSIRHYSEEGTALGENRYWWSSPDIIVCKGKKVGDVEFTFNKYPQVKTIKCKSFSACYYYDANGHIIRLVVIPPKDIAIGYCFGCCYSFEYNDYGDLISTSAQQGRYSSPESFEEYCTQPSKRYDCLSWNVGMGYYYCIPQQHPQEETIWRYIYDSEGNWIQKDCYIVKHGEIDVEDLQETTTREYVYY